jgi:RNA polymerase sigma factor (TIGR02999 family)
VPNRRSPSAGSGAADWPTRAALVDELQGGGRAALDRAVAGLYDELREIAHRLRVRRDGDTVDTLTLVHEAYLKLAHQESARWNDRAHFLALAAVVMRHVLTDLARGRFRTKRDGDRIAVPLDEIAIAAPDQAGAVIDVADALEQLERADPRLARVVEYRFFGGLTNDEIATVLGVDARTVRRDWARARTLLRSSLAP